VQGHDFQVGTIDLTVAVDVSGYDRIAGIDARTGDIVLNPALGIWLPPARLRLEVIVRLHPEVVRLIAECAVSIPVAAADETGINVDVALSPVGGASASHVGSG